MLACWVAHPWLGRAFLCIALCSIFAFAAPDDDGAFFADKRKLVTLLTTAVLAVAPGLFDVALNGSTKKKARKAYPHRNRKRRSVSNMMDELGPCHVRRACRMTQPTFFELCGILQPHLSPPRQNRRNKLKGAKNGLISGETRLSSALRYFAGGRPEDISIVHGISHSEVFNSLWKVVDAVNVCPAFAIEHPSCFAEQRKIAAAFKKKSEAGFSMCAGAIGCMLVWIEKPNNDQCGIAKVGAKKWMCGRKKKFGITLQGTCDVDGRFLDVAMEHPASTSDFLAFTTSTLQFKMEEPSFLAPGLCMFGDNAHVNCRYVATPCRQSTVGTISDNYNFFHSQVSAFNWSLLHCVSLSNSFFLRLS